MHSKVTALACLACLVRTANGRQTQALLSSLDLPGTMELSEPQAALTSFLLALSPTSLPNSRLAHVADIPAGRPRMMAAEKSCALITLKEVDDVKAVAKVLKKSYMEGGIKRGLVGTVLVQESGEVQIQCVGKQDKVSSFAEWIETSSGLVKSVDFVEEECSVAQLSNNFPLADAEGYSGGKPGSFQGALADSLKSAALDIKTKAGRTHSNDEGLF